MFHVYWPACAFLTMFVVCVMMAILKFGPRYCKTRHTTLPPRATDEEWDSKTYSHDLSVSVA